MRPQPTWLINDDLDYEEVELGRLKSGKEAEVFVIERSYGERSCLLAHKRYRPRRVTNKGELEALGFERTNSFMNDLEYRDGRRFAKSRDQRAVDRMTGYGKELLTRRWTGHELEMMERAWDAGVLVPYPVGARGDGMLMEYVGSHERAAPALAEARLERDELQLAWSQLTDSLRALVGAGYVHADLSAYNILWWDDRVWLIDFPQAVDLTVNPHAHDFLQRDVANVSRWFAARRVSVDADEFYGELVSLACRF